jgi:periplasmic protein TonB
MYGSSALLHLAVASAVVVLGQHSWPIAAAPQRWSAEISPPEIRHVVFIVGGEGPARGGGGGGNREAGPIRRAESVGTDAITLRVAKPISTAGRTIDAPPLPQVLLDAMPLASGSVEQVGLPTGGVSFGTSTGPGSGGGVGDGVGTGLGSGSGPGVGPGSGGGFGGGAYRPGGAVTAPRVLTEVKPTYTHEALLQKIQGTVVLELVVQANGSPSRIRVVRSLYPDLDEQAANAVSQWRFEPGRLAGRPVDVLVTVMLDFSIR